MMRTRVKSLRRVALTAEGIARFARLPAMWVMTVGAGYPGGMHADSREKNRSCRPRRAAGHQRDRARPPATTVERHRRVAQHSRDRLRTAGVAHGSLRRLGSPSPMCGVLSATPARPPPSAKSRPFAHRGFPQILSPTGRIFPSRSISTPMLRGSSQAHGRLRIPHLSLTTSY